VTYLLDTNVVSELRRHRPDPAVSAWFAGVEADDLFLSALVVGEIVAGVERIRRRDPHAVVAYDSWLAELREAFADRIVPVDLAAAEEWGRMTVPDPLPVVDGLLAATAKVRGWTLVTRNVRDIARTGVRVLDPFTSP
jgi:predicted nucleic acid-binding protein